ncbi:MAG TPA: bifunctional folylpolyglutamate synthase/dihydrofolate synthase [Mesotoga infera]|uniref:Dihydrofolate synthase/folylpolyglutamate synthase n=1 Tax=Mesotoga infera TaxID=1236046 RepID=A0A7C1CX54_9BACT|nr:bifunctional folylpolyglutamate synthase/dihydrofolate synthase [Mesotoga infera]
MKKYAEAIQYLYNSRPYGKIKYGLYRIRELLERLGNPQESYPIVHITGTNGKGSVATIARSILTTHGFRTGLNISPHITTFRERIQVDGSDISEDDVCETLRKLEPSLEKMDRKGEEYAPSFFEVVTAMSFLHFKEKKCDAVVLEVGLGGRFDASNVIDSSLVSVITSVGLDHTAILGDTEEKIAKEKSGIIKYNSPVVSGITRPAIRRIVSETAGRLDAPAFFYQKDFDAYGREYNINKNTFDYRGKKSIRNLRIRLNGEHQIANAAVAIKATEIGLEKIGNGVDERRLREALENVRWPGRFEVFSVNSKTVVLDGAHNPEAAKVLRRTVERYFPDEKITLLFGSLDDKDYESNIKTLSNITDRVIVCRVPNHRSVHPERVADTWRKYCSFVDLVESHEAAFETALCTSEKILVCGSLYLVSEIRNSLTGVKESAGRH